MAQVDTLYSCWMLSRRRRAKLPDSWSSYASNMERRIGSGRNLYSCGTMSGSKRAKLLKQLEHLRLKYGEENWLR
jgi:hypothetical protein